MSRYFRLTPFRSTAWIDDPSDSSEDDMLELPQLSFDRALSLTASEVADIMREEHNYLDNAQRCVAREREKFQSAIKQLWDELHKERQRWELKEKQASLAHIPESDIIELDIGGQKVLTTSLRTLRKYPDSALAAMFSGRHPILRHKGRALVDRDPKPFASVVSFLQTGRMPRDLSSSEEAAFHDEMDFWGIPLTPPETAKDSVKEFDPRWCAPTLTLEGGNRVVRKAGEFHGIVFTSVPLDAGVRSVEFRVTMDTENKFRMFLGLVDRRVYQPRYLVSLLWKEAPCSYYWDILNNKLIKTDESGQHKCMKDYGCQCESLDGVFGVSYDAEARTVSFYKSRICQGVAFTDVPEGLYPAIDIWFAAGTVSIV